MYNKRIIDISLLPFKYNRFLTKDLIFEYKYYIQQNNISMINLDKNNYFKETYETDNIIYLNIMDEKGDIFCRKNNIKTQQLKSILFNLSLPY